MYQGSYISPNSILTSLSIPPSPLPRIITIATYLPGFPASTLVSLQSIFNTVATVSLSTCKSDHIMFVFKQNLLQRDYIYIYKSIKISEYRLTNKCKVMLTEFYVYSIIWFQKSSVLQKNDSILLTSIAHKVSVLITNLGLYWE